MSAQYTYLYEYFSILLSEIIDIQYKTTDIKPIEEYVAIPSNID